MIIKIILKYHLLNISKNKIINKLIENNMFGNYKNINSEETEEKKENVILSKIKRKIKEKFDIDIKEKKMKLIIQFLKSMKILKSIIKTKKLEIQ